MKALFLILLVLFVALNIVGIVDDPHDPFQAAWEEFLAHPDFAYQAELDGDFCAVPVYFVGPLAIEDRSDCNRPWVVTTR